MLKTFVFALASLVAMLATGGSVLCEEQDALEDKDIMVAVERALAEDGGVPSHLIDVAVESGIVTLSGSVDNILAKERAVMIAQSVLGVRSVIDELEVKPVERSDKQIRRDVVDALVLDPATDPLEVDAKVDGGIVTLTGNVSSYAERKLCADVAKGVKGVRDLKNEIAVIYGYERPDDDIKYDIERRLEVDVWIGGSISVEVENGHVTLKGSVASAFERERAKSQAWVAGAKSVDADGLQVKWWTHDKMQRRERYSDLSDEKVKKAIQDTFENDPRVWSFVVNVHVNEGVATLTGSVDNMNAKYAAEEDANNTVGVWRVMNRIRVRPMTYIHELEVSMERDKEIAKAVEDALSRDPYMDHYDIKVYVHNSKVNIYGTVESQFEKYHAEDVISRVKGVAEIENRLEFNKEWTQKTDREIKQDIADELFWSPFVDSDEIEVTVEDGIASLKGTVGTWFEFNKAQENALEGGARWVKNRLKVEYGPLYYLPL